MQIGSQTLWSQTRTYDSVGNVLGLSTVVPTQGGGSMTENESFCYDALNRLVWAGNSGTPSGGDHCMAPPTGTTLPAYTQSYTYDSLDRILQGPAGQYSGHAVQAHSLTDVSSVPNQYAAYDAMGNMTCRNTDPTTAHTCGGSTPTGALMSYDAHGQLANWTAPTISLIPRVTECRLAKMAAGALLSGAGQMVSNTMSGKPLIEGVGEVVLLRILLYITNLLFLYQTHGRNYPIYGTCGTYSVESNLSYECGE